VQLQNLTSGTGIATIGCTIAEPQGLPIVMNAHSGCGTHPDARIALTRALTEAAQTRLTCIQGGREDLPDLARTSGPRRPRRGTMVAIASASTISRLISIPPSTMTSSSSLNECANSVLIKSLFRPAHRTERQIAERRKSAGCEAGALQESSAIRTIVRFIRLLANAARPRSPLFTPTIYHRQLSIASTIAGPDFRAGQATLSKPRCLSA
jgi:hypothetical protein